MLPSMPDIDFSRRRFLAGVAGTVVASRWLAPGLIDTLAARPIPSASQLEWQRDELALFLHFGVNTFTDREWGDGHEDPAIFNPSSLDAGSWAQAARAAGAKAM